MRRMWVVVALCVLAWASGDAFAAAPGGASCSGSGGVGVGGPCSVGVGGPGGAPLNPPVAPPGGNPGGGGGGGGGRPGAAPAKKPEFKKWDLPAPEEVKRLKDVKIDQALAKLNLTDAQLDQIVALKLKIAGEEAAYAEAQLDARKAYEQSTNETDSSACGQKVLSVAKAIKAFDPDKKYWDGLGTILSKDQMAKLRELLR
ncbi:MAG: hypothetical protein HY291_15450 [Planctomycetes bacterium]|nr:hypothetical protein [Planctomycetota bacterium]